MFYMLIYHLQAFLNDNSIKSTRIVWNSLKMTSLVILYI